LLPLLWKRWKSQQISIARGDLLLKHRMMANAVFPFMRSTLLQEQIIGSAVRIRDPHLPSHDNWMIRRLAPDCCRIELASLPEQRDEERLLYAMGWETANIHLGSATEISAVKKDLGARRGRWLHKAGKAMPAETRKDWKIWRKAWKERHGES
jgi:hypothetical protein